MATQLELLKEAQERVKAKYGPDARSLKDLQAQIDTIESIIALRSRVSEPESEGIDRFVAQVVTKSNATTPVTYPVPQETSQEPPLETSPVPALYQVQSSPSEKTGSSGDEG